MTNNLSARYTDAVLDTARAMIALAESEGVSADGWQSPNPTRLEPEQVATAFLYLAAGPVKVLGSVRGVHCSSYSWKHQAERWGRLVGLAPYVSNGAFIAAADGMNVPSGR